MWSGNVTLYVNYLFVALFPRNGSQVNPLTRGTQKHVTQLAQVSTTIRVLLFSRSC